VSAFRLRKITAQFRFTACALALALLTLETAALTHELRHDLHQHDDASCVLHLYADHLAKTPAAHAHVVTVITRDAARTPTAVTLAALWRGTHYRSRAPPRSSDTSIV